MTYWPSIANIANISAVGREIRLFSMANLLVSKMSQSNSYEFKWQQCAVCHPLVKRISDIETISTAYGNTIFLPFGLWAGPKD